MVLTDLRLPGMDGLELLALIRRQNAQVPVVVMTAFGTVENAVEAMKIGRHRFPAQAVFARSPDDGGQQGAGSARPARREPAAQGRTGPALRVRQHHRPQPGRCRRSSPPSMRVAPTRATVLLAGESGVGKDLIARAIHFHSPRRDRPFVKINCTALPENLMESELFGYEKGAFTGRRRNRSRASSSRPTPARCFWTRSATCRRRFR